ncbi:hypothetical protein, partial [Streptomyces capoamus]|uniref:hypothetical protein n=1 Tax=Streptomyces capoamus TaxID=68183 RepID=UPI001E4B0D85
MALTGDDAAYAEMTRSVRDGSRGGRGGRHRVAAEDTGAPAYAAVTAPPPSALGARVTEPTAAPDEKPFLYVV